MVPCHAEQLQVQWKLPSIFSKRQEIRSSIQCHKCVLMLLFWLQTGACLLTIFSFPVSYCNLGHTDNWRGKTSYMQGIYTSKPLNFRFKKQQIWTHLLTPQDLGNQVTKFNQKHNSHTPSPPLILTFCIINLLFTEKKVSILKLYKFCKKKPWLKIYITFYFTFHFINDKMTSR